MLPTGSLLLPTHFSEDDFVHFGETNRAMLDDNIMQHPFPWMYGDLNCSRNKTKVFSDLVPFTKYPHWSMGSRDFFDGAKPGTIKPRVCRDLLTDVTKTYNETDQADRTTAVRASYILPCNMPSYPALPNFSLEAKRPAGMDAMAMCQACYNGVLGARAMHRLWHYARGSDDWVCDENAETIACAYSGGQLNIYAFYVTAPVTPGDDPQCYMTSPCAFALIDKSDTVPRGRLRHPNLRFWACVVGD
ncbi:MAG: hypothetical protein M1826_007087 [Phylliscum demangeonii]|nr:MAG: hypothetical protein M1826_007087 [Phylliscum demangeonii]